VINIKTRIHYERNFRKIIILILVVIIIISAIATTTLYIKENFKHKKGFFKSELKDDIEGTLDIFDNLPSDPLSLPPE